MGKKMLVRILSLVLAVIMLITLVPADTLSFGDSGGSVSVAETSSAEEAEMESPVAEEAPLNVIRDGVQTSSTDESDEVAVPDMLTGAADEETTAAVTAAPEMQVPAEETTAPETTAPETQIPAEETAAALSVLHLDLGGRYHLYSEEGISAAETAWTVRAWNAQEETRYQENLQLIRETQEAILNAAVRNENAEGIAFEGPTALYVTTDAWRNVSPQELAGQNIRLYLSDPAGRLNEVPVQIRLTEEGIPALFFTTAYLADLMIALPAADAAGAETETASATAETVTAPAETETSEAETETEAPADAAPGVNPAVHPLAEVGPSDNEPLLAVDQLSARTRAMLGLSTGRFMLRAAAPAPIEGPVTEDGQTIERVSVEWLSRSAGEADPAGKGTLVLRTDTDSVGNQQFQINFVLSGRDDHEPGAVEIIFPAYIWHDRYGNEPGNLTLSVPEEPGTGADFAWRRVGDNIVITNVRRLSPAAKVMIQGTFRNVSPQNMVDVDVAEGSAYSGAANPGVSDPFAVTIGITTPNDNYISLQSNTIDAQIDTHVEAASATKSAYNTSRREYYVYHTVDQARSEGSIPQAFLDSLGDEADQYSFVRWYVSGSATGSQPFLMTLNDSFDGTVIHYLDAQHQNSETLNVSGKMLGAQGVQVPNGDGTYSTGDVLSDDGETVSAVLFDGYSTLTKSAYVWTAYRQSDFPVEGDDYQITNSQTIEVTGWDDQITTTKSATATAPFRIPITYTAVKIWDDGDNAAGRRPSGQYFHIDYRDAAGNHYGGHTMTAAEATDGDNNWTYSWSDLGRERSYSVYENTSDDIFRDHIIEGTRNYGEDEYGRFVEYDVWWYARVRSVYDSETHTWTITNKYRERHVKLYEIPFAVPAANASANKTTEYDYSYRFSNRMSRNDRALNILRRGEDVVISYNVSGTADTIAYSRGNGMTGDRLVDYGRREVTLQLEDNYFDHIFGGGVNNSLLLDNSLRMTLDDAEIAYVTLNRPGFAQYGQWGTNAPAGTPQQDWIFYGWSYKSFTPNVVPVEILYGYQNGAWVEFARITTENGSTRVTPSNGATVASGTYNVNLPAGVERVRTELTVPSADSADQTSWANRIDSATMGYTVGVRLLADSDTIQQRLEAVFAQNDYGMCTLDNFVTLNLIDDQDHMFRSETAQSRAYLHGRNHRVAVRQEKVFELIENDLFNQQLLLHSTVTMTQQSNILERDEYWDAREEGLIPSTTSGTWYDLLPVGIMPDIDSVRLTSGDRITDIYTIENYRETGRVMLVVKAELTPNVTYTNTTDPNPYRNDDTYPKEGFKDVHTLEFDAWYSWEQARLYGIDSSVRNVAAFETDDTALGNIPGWSGEPDDPTANHNQRAMNAVGDDRDLMTGLDPDRTDEHTAFVYSGAVLRHEEVDFLAATELRKYVTRDGLGLWTSGRDGRTQVTVHEGDFYTYMLYVASDNESSTRNIIFFDDLDGYVPQEADEGDYGHGRWQGLFHSVDVSGLQAMGIAPVVYYNTRDDVDLSVLTGGNTSSGSSTTALEDPDYAWNILQNTPGWTTELPDDPQTVRAIAVDLRHNQDGTDFELAANESLNFTVRMRAPIYETSGEATDPFNADEALREFPENNDYAYNDVYMGCTQVSPIGQQTHAAMNYNYTRVGIVPFSLEVTKVWDDANNIDGVRPNAIDVRLLANGDRMDPDRVITLDEGNDWTGVFEHVIQYDDDGNWINYTFEEESADPNPAFNLDGYTMNVSRRGSDVTLTNTHTPTTTSLSFTKTWEGDEADENIVFRPQSITVRLLADGVFTGRTLTVRPDRTGAWAGTFTNLPMYSNPSGLSGNQHRIEYSVEEEDVYKYQDSYETDPDTGVIAITNTFYPFGDLCVGKTVTNATEVSADQAFTFSLLLQDSDGNDVTEKYSYTIWRRNAEDNTQIDEISTGTIGNGDTFELHDGEYLTVHDIPSETHYQVVESETPGFELTASSGTEGGIRAGATQNASFTNEYNSEGSLTLSAFKTLTGRTMTRAQFRFELMDLTDVDLSDAEAVEAALAGDSMRLESSDASGNVTFSRIVYDESDHGRTFQYLMREVDRGRPGYTYDVNTYLVRVAVTDNGDGTMTSTPTYYLVGRTDDGPDYSDLTEITDPANHETGVVFRNEYHAEGSIVLRAWKQMPDGDLTDYDPFLFLLWGTVNDRTSEHYGQSGILQIESSDQATGAVTFEPLNFTEADVGQTYLYVIREAQLDPEDYPGVIFDQTLRGVELTVEDNGNGTLAITQTNVTVEAELDDDGNIVSASRAAETTELPVFVNELEPGRLTVTKLTTWDEDGAEPPADAQFPFVLTLVGDEQHPLPETITVSLSNASGQQPYTGEGNTVPALTQEEMQPHDVELTDGTYRFTLRAGQMLNVDDLPAGIAYQVQEDTPSGWTLVTENAAGVIHPYAAGGASASRFTNTYEPGKATATLVASKRMDGGTPETGRYAFELVDNTEGSSTYGEVIRTEVNQAGGFISFNMVYDTPGTYSYTIREVQGLVAYVDTDGTIRYVDADAPVMRTVSFDENEYTVIVTVNETVVDGNRTLTAEVSYEDETPPQFLNTTNPGSLQITKIGEGLTQANEDAEFTFRIRLSNDAGMPLTAGDGMFWYAQPSETVSPVEPSPAVPEAPANAEPEVTRTFSMCQAESMRAFTAVRQNFAASVPALMAAGANGAPVLRAAADKYAGGIAPTTTEYYATGFYPGGTAPNRVRWTIYKDGTMIIEPENGVSGTFNLTSSSYNYNGNFARITKVRVLGTCKVTSSCAHMFDCNSNYAFNIRYADLRGMDVSSCTNYFETFDYCNNQLQYLDISTWNIPSNASTRWLTWGNSGGLQILKIGPGYRSTNADTFSSDMGNWRCIEHPELGNVNVRSIARNGTAGTRYAGTWVRTGYNPTFTIAFDANGGTGSMASVSASLATPPTLPPCEFQSDLNFAGWSTDPNALVPEYADGATFTGAATSGQTITLYAIWMGENDFLLHYDANGGYVRTQWQRVHGPEDSVTMPTPTHPSSYEFLYWTTNADGTGERYSGTVSGADFHAEAGETVTLYAQFLDPSHRARVTVEHYQQNADENGYSLIDTDFLGAFDIGDTVTPEHKDYRGFKTPSTFMVYAGAATTGTQQNEGTEVTVVRGGVTIRYYYDRTHYQLAFNGNGGEGSMANMSMTGGVSAKLPVSRFTREDAIFVGWNTAPDGSGTNYGDGQNVNSIGGDGETVTLYAQWFSLDDASSLEPTNGEYIVHCHANETIIFPMLPAGTHYEVVETDLPDGWTLSGIDAGSGTVLSAERINVTATNAYNAVGYADITVHKSLPGESIAEGRFTFQLVDESGTVIQTVSNSPMDTMEMTYDDEGAPIENPYYGTAPVNFNTITYTEQGVYHYTVREVSGSEASIRYDAHEEHVTVYVKDRGDGRLTTQVLYDVSGADFMNTMSDGDLTVSKAITNATDLASEQTFTFTVYLFDSQDNVITAQYPVELPDGTTTTISNGGAVTIRGGESFTVKGLPHNSRYLVVEVPANGYELAASTNAEGVIHAGETQYAAFTNAYNSRTDTEGGVGAVIEAVKVFEHGTIGEEQFAFRLLDSAGEEVETVYADTEGHVRFSELHFDLEDDENRITYYLEEVVPAEEDKDPHITYDGHRERVTVIPHDQGDGTMISEIVYDGETEEEQAQPPVFTNEYHPEPTDITIPVVKKVTGNPPANETFTFRLAPVTDGAPMPESDTVTITGAGQASFGSITFLYGGVYEYTLTEVGGSATGYTYDTAPRTIIVTVTDTNGVLSAAWQSNGQTVSAVEFTNTYTPPETPPTPPTPVPPTPEPEPETPPVTPPTPPTPTPPTPAPPVPITPVRRYTTITDDAVPLAIPGGPKLRAFRTGKTLETIEDEEVPLALPETGDVSGLWMWLSAFGGSGAAMLGAAVKRRKKKEK